MRTNYFRRRNRRGAAAVEFALTVPLVFLFFMASIEFGRVYMIRQTLENAVYEAARRGLVPATTDTEIRQTAADMLGSIRVNNPDISIAQDDQSVSVTIELDISDSSWVPPLFFRGKQLTSTLTMAKDRG